ncbi:MAG: glutamyl-tRNA reductase, partial [Victivallales bacterium]|nr:glutamyl-tRNA reductase [Victivallales bacterium]
MHLLTLGLNHTTAPVEVRERLAFAEGDQPDSLRQLREGYGLSEVAILSTCNRSEIYASSDGPHLEPVRRYLAEQRRLDVADLAPCFYEYVDAEAATHLFRVSSGIDSLVIGESQILKQVREALETSQAVGSARLVINEVFQRALRVGKRARTETDIGRGHLSVSTAAVELASQIFDNLESRSALLLGAGEMIELTAQYLIDTGLSRFVVANRTVERAADLARRFQAKAVALDGIAQHLLDVDIVIASTAAPGFVLAAETVRHAMSQRRGRPLFLIDIAVPRDIDPAVRSLDNVFLFDMDDLETVVASNRQDREGEIRRVQAIVDDELGNFLHWFNALGAGPLIRALRQQAGDLQTAELDRWTAKLGHLSDDDRQLVEQVLRGYANKLLHQPLVQIREFANRDDGYLRLDTVRRLFDLDTDAD